jgi:hypothetical protein
MAVCLCADDQKYIGQSTNCSQEGELLPEAHLLNGKHLLRQTQLHQGTYHKSLVSGKESCPRVSDQRVKVPSLVGSTLQHSIASSYPIKTIRG